MNVLRKAYRWLKRFIQWQRFIFTHFQKPLPVYAKTSEAGLKLHVGAGEINIQGWVNVDGRKFEHTHLVSDGFDLIEFSDDSIEEIYLCHVLEHFSFEEGVDLLKHFRGKLKKGGVLRLSVPDFDALVTAYMENDNDINSIKSPLMGGQDYSYNYHKAIFNQSSLESLLGECGFSQSVKWNTLDDFGVDLGDWSNGEISTPSKDIPISLNLKAVKV